MGKGSKIARLVTDKLDCKKMSYHAIDCAISKPYHLKILV